MNVKAGELRATLEIAHKTYYLKNGSYILGKRSNEVVQDIQIDVIDDSVDVKHAGFYITSTGVKLLDLFSKNGTYIDSSKLEICTAVDIPRQATLRFGNIECYYRENDETDSEFLGATSPFSNPKNISDFIPASPEQDKEISQKGINRNRSRYRKQLTSISSSSFNNKKLESPNEIANKSHDSFLVPATQDANISYESKIANISNELKEKIAILEAEDEFYVPETQEIFEKLKPSERESNGFICINTQEFQPSFNNNSNDSDNLFFHLDTSMPIDYIDHNKDYNEVNKKPEDEVRNDANKKVENNLNKNITEEDDVETDCEEELADPVVTGESKNKKMSEDDVDTDCDEELSAAGVNNNKSEAKIIEGNMEILENKSKGNDGDDDDDTDCEEIQDLNEIITDNKLNSKEINDIENIQDKDDDETDCEEDMSALKWNESSGSNINKKPEKAETAVRLNPSFTSNNLLNKTDYDIDDLEPTQVFIKPSKASIGSHINISPSNKENISNFDTENLDDSDLEKTQVFLMPKNLPIRPASASKVASTPKSTKNTDVFLVPTPIKPPQIQKPSASNDDDDDYDLEPTQAFVQPKSTIIPPIVIDKKNDTLDENDDDLAETQVFHFKKPVERVVGRSPSPVLLDSDEEENNAEFCFQATLEVGAAQTTEEQTHTDRKNSDIFDNNKKKSTPARKNKLFGSSDEDESKSAKFNTKNKKKTNITKTKGGSKNSTASSRIPSTSRSNTEMTYNTPNTQFNLDILTPVCDFIKLPDIEKIKRAKTLFEVTTTNYKRSKLLLEGSSDEEEDDDYHHNNNDKNVGINKKQHKINTKVKDEINKKPNEGTQTSRRKHKISEEKGKQELLSSKSSTSKKKYHSLESPEKKKPTSKTNAKHKNDDKNKVSDEKKTKNSTSSSSSTRSSRLKRTHNTHEREVPPDTRARTMDNKTALKKSSTNDEQPRRSRTLRVQSMENNTIVPTITRRTSSRVKSVSSDFVGIKEARIRKDSTSDLTSGGSGDGKTKNQNSKPGRILEEEDIIGRKLDKQFIDFEYLKDFKNCRVVIKKEVHLHGPSKPPNTRKRPIDNPEESTTNKRNHQESISESSSIAVATRKSSRSKPLVLFTKIDSSPFEKDILKIGGLIVDNPNECNVLITDQVCRTWKFLAAMAKGVPIVSTKWLDSIIKGDNIHFSTDDYIIHDPNSEKRFKFKLRKSLYLAKHQPIFKNYTFFLTANTRPPPAELHRIIECGAGKVILDITDNLNVNQYFYVVSEKVDISLWPKIRRIVPCVRIISTEGIMLAVMQQYIHFKDHILS